MSLEDELSSLTNFGMDEKQILSSLNDAVNKSSKIDPNNINLDDIDNLDANDDDLNDPDLLKELNLITDGKGSNILNASVNTGIDDIDELKGLMSVNDEEEILDPRLTQPNFQTKKVAPVQLKNSGSKGQIPDINKMGNISNIYKDDTPIGDDESNQLLQSMGINIGNKPAAVNKPRPQPPRPQPPKPQRVQSAAPQNAGATVNNNGGISFEEKMKCQNLARLEKYIEEEQKLANIKLKQRDLEGARKAMDNLKALKERFTQLGREKKKQALAGKGASKDALAEVEMYVDDEVAKPKPKSQQQQPQQQRQIQQRQIQQQQQTNMEQGDEEEEEEEEEKN